jgi:hypothetical protein
LDAFKPTEKRGEKPFLEKKEVLKDEVLRQVRGRAATPVPSSATGVGKRRKRGILEGLRRRLACLVALLDVHSFFISSIKINFSYQNKTTSYYPLGNPIYNSL